MPLGLQHPNPVLHNPQCGKYLGSGLFWVSLVPYTIDQLLGLNLCCLALALLINCQPSGGVASAAPTEHAAGSSGGPWPRPAAGREETEMGRGDVKWLGAWSQGKPQSFPESGWPGLEAPA